MKENYTHIGIVLDRSGSMASCLEQTIEGFNTFIDEQKKVDGEATVTFAKFDNEYDLVYDMVDLKEVAHLDTSTFKPRGSTALYDAMGRTIVSIGESLAEMDEVDRPSKVIVVTITDGGENSSTEWIDPPEKSVDKPEDIFAAWMPKTCNKLKELITQQQDDYSWEFVFIGANQDAVLTAKGMGISANSSLTYAADKKGTQDLYASLSEQMVHTRCAVDAEFSFSDKDREKQSR